MTLTHADARSWARARSAAEEPRLGMLEAVAFQEHPDLVATFGSDGAVVAEILTRRRSSPARQGSPAVLAILGVIAPVEQALAAPVGTLFTLDPIRRSTP